MAKYKVDVTYNDPKYEPTICIVKGFWMCPVIDFTFSQALHGWDEAYKKAERICRWLNRKAIK